MKCVISIIGLSLIIQLTLYGQTQENTYWTLPHPEQVTLHDSLMARAIEAGVRGRITSLPEAKDGYWFNLYSRASKAEDSTEYEARLGRNWQGEHVGKWLISAARAANRTQDPKLIALVKEKAAYLLVQQDDSGYLATYIPSQRFYSETRTDWSKTWDIWSSSYNMMGLLEINRYWPDKPYIEAATKIGDLLYQTFYKTGKSVAYRGNHYGLSSVVLIEPIVDLYTTTGERKYLDFAREIMRQIEARPELKLMERTLSGGDIYHIGDGKIYQLLWIYTGIAKLYKATGETEYLQAAEKAWQCVTDKHLTPTGGPWGGIGGVGTEKFNRGFFWSPYGLIETCNIMSWIHLNRELLTITGAVKYAEMLERVFYNALLGAQYYDGERWHYFSHTNGLRSVGAYHACCRSSGMLSLEEFAPLVFAQTEDGIAVNLYAPCTANLRLSQDRLVTVTQNTDYPMGETILIQIDPKRDCRFTLLLRIPVWTHSSRIEVNGQAFKKAVTPGSFVMFDRHWQRGDTVTLIFPMSFRFETKQDYYQQSKDYYHKLDWFSLAKGPLVYATHGLIYGTEREEAFRFDLNFPEKHIREVSPPEGCLGPAIEFRPFNKKPLLMMPFCDTGGIEPGQWRLTWLQLAQDR